MNWRGKVFKIKDHLQKGKIASHLNEVKTSISNHTTDEGALKRLVKHANKTTPFYQGHKHFNQFPIINKSLIKSRFEAFRSSKFPSPKDVLSMTTSGSTGTPFTIIQDINKKHRNYADTIYFGSLGGYEVGNKLFYFKIWAKEKLKSSFNYWLQNIKPIDVLNLNDERVAELLIDFESSSKENCNILGYVSAIEQIVKYCERKDIRNIDTNFRGILTMSESLSDKSRSKMSDLFSCPVYSRYSNLENGIIAQQTSVNTDSFLVNKASYKVEIFHLEKDELVDEGQVGRIVITDLFNYAMPMIRYDTGDIGSLVISDDGRTYLSRIEGRKLDVLYNTSGEIISSFVMYKNMWKYTEILQYQLIQVDKRVYTFRINCQEEFDRERELIAEFLEYLGEDAEFSIEYVDEIPLLSSGKRRKTVNLYRKN